MKKPGEGLAGIGVLLFLTALGGVLYFHGTIWASVFLYLVTPLGLVCVLVGLIQYGKKTYTRDEAAEIAAEHSGANRPVPQALQFRSTLARVATFFACLAPAGGGFLFLAIGFLLSPFILSGDQNPQWGTEDQLKLGLFVSAWLAGLGITIKNWPLIQAGSRYQGPDLAFNQEGIQVSFLLLTTVDQKRVALHQPPVEKIKWQDLREIKLIPPRGRKGDWTFQICFQGNRPPLHIVRTYIRDIESQLLGAIKAHRTDTSIS
jgi:hypothetical protein